MALAGQVAENYGVQYLVIVFAVGVFKAVANEYSQVVRS
jgi:hypothetical protein